MPFPVELCHVALFAKSHGRFDDAARLMEQITTSDELIDFLTLPGYRLLA